MCSRKFKWTYWRCRNATVWQTRNIAVTRVMQTPIIMTTSLQPALVQRKPPHPLCHSYACSPDCYRLYLFHASWRYAWDVTSQLPFAMSFCRRDTRSIEDRYIVFLFVIFIGWWNNQSGKLKLYQSSALPMSPSFPIDSDGTDHREIIPVFCTSRVPSACAYTMIEKAIPKGKYIPRFYL